MPTTDSPARAISTVSPAKTTALPAVPWPGPRIASGIRAPALHLLDAATR